MDGADGRSFMEEYRNRVHPWFLSYACYVTMDLSGNGGADRPLAAHAEATGKIKDGQAIWLRPWQSSFSSDKLGT
jgi:hypothetical protein